MVDYPIHCFCQRRKGEPSRLRGDGQSRERMRRLNYASKHHKVRRIRLKMPQTISYQSVKEPGLTTTIHTFAAAERAFRSLLKDLTVLRKEKGGGANVRRQNVMIMQKHPSTGCKEPLGCFISGATSHSRNRLLYPSAKGTQPAAGLHPQAFLYQQSLISYSTRAGLGGRYGIF